MDFDKMYTGYKHDQYNFCTINEGAISFSDKYETGVSIIDEHHKIFVEIINMLFHCSRHELAKQVLMPSITAFKHNMGVHYQTERLLLAFSDEAYATLYDMNYTELCRRLVIVEWELRKDFDIDPLVRFLKGWWLQHMESHAEFFRPYVSNPGVTH